MPIQFPAFGIVNCGACTFGDKLDAVNSIFLSFSGYTLVASYLSTR